MIHYYNLFISFVYLVGDVWTPDSFIYKRVPWPEEQEIFELTRSYIANEKGVLLDHLVILNIIKMCEVE